MDVGSRHTIVVNPHRSRAPSMNCPSCGVEMVSLEGEDLTLRKCAECGGLWIDVSDLNRLLLHHNLPGLESLGGKMDAEAMAGQCSDCQVDLVTVVGGDRNNPLQYTSCESCGGTFLESETKDATTAAQAVEEIVGFFKEWSNSKNKKKKVGA